MSRRLCTLAAAAALATSLATVRGADVGAADDELPAAELLEYGPESPDYVAVGDVRALAATATGIGEIPVAAISGIPALGYPNDPVPWLDPDTITEFAHFGPTAISTEDGPEMITVIATSQDPDDLGAGLEAAGWVPSGTNRFVNDASFRDVASANWVYVGDGVVVWAPHERHLDVALDSRVGTSTELPVIEALARASGNRRAAMVVDADTDCGGIVAAGDDAAGGGTVVLAVGDDAHESRVEVDENTFFDRRESVIHAVDHTIDSGHLVITTAVDDPTLQSYQWSTTSVVQADGVFDRDALYRC